MSLNAKSMWASISSRRPARKKQRRHERVNWPNLLARVGCASYSEYLRSDHWAAFKARFLSRPENQVCFICRESPVDVHHRTYRNLGRELFGDVVSLCRFHHNDLHEKLKQTNRDLKRFSKSFIHHRRKWWNGKKQQQSLTERVDVDEVSSVAQAAASNGLVNKTKRSGQTPAADVKPVTADQYPDGTPASALTIGHHPGCLPGRLRVSTVAAS